MGTFFYKKLTVNPEGDRRAKRGGTDPECSKAAEERAAQQRLTPAERMHARVHCPMSQNRRPPTAHDRSSMIPAQVDNCPAARATT